MLPFLPKKCEEFAPLIFSAKNISTEYFVSTRRLHESLTHGNLNLTMLWKTGPRFFDKFNSTITLRKVSNFNVTAYQIIKINDAPCLLTIHYCLDSTNSCHGLDKRFFLSNKWCHHNVSMMSAVLVLTKLNYTRIA